MGRRSIITLWTSLRWGACGLAAALTLGTFAATDAEARSYGRKGNRTRSSGSMQKAAYHPDRDSGYGSSGGSATLGGMAVRNDKSQPSNFAVKGSAGLVTGFSGLDSSPTILSADLLYYVSRSLYIPMGFSTWDGDMSVDVDGETYGFGFGITTVDTGIGYDWHPSRRLNLGLGSRIGWAKMEADYQGETILKKEGWNLTPFLGLSFSPTVRATIGFESRLPIVIVKDTSEDDDDDEEDEDDDGGDSKIPLYHMLTLAIRLP